MTPTHPFTTFRATLLSYIEDFIKGILEEDGSASSGSMDGDIKQLFDLAKQLGRDSNESFFSKVCERRNRIFW